MYEFLFVTITALLMVLACSIVMLIPFMVFHKFIGETLVGEIIAKTFIYSAIGSAILISLIVCVGLINLLVIMLA